MCKLLNYRDAAAILQIEPGTLRKWVSQGRINIVKIGSCVRFKTDDLEKWINDHIVEGNKS